MQLTRRKLLGAVGLGALGVGVGIRGRADPDFTAYTYASPGDLDDRRLRVAWYEQYNGTTLEHQGGTGNVTLDEALDPGNAPDYVQDATFVTDGTGPVISVGNVLPGDEGTLVIGLEAVEDGEFVPEPLDVWLRAAITADEERGRTGPERAAGDTTDDAGELDDELIVDLWRDGSPLGTCNGRKEFDEDLEGSIVPSAPVSEAFAVDSAVAAATGTRVLDGLRPGQSRCFALAWSFPSDTSTNRSQGDAVRFDLDFGGVPVDGASPFDEATREEA
jgi:hypothetical protein